MSEYVVIDTGGAWEIGRENDHLIAACECGGGVVVLDKGLGRATVAAWKTRHRACEDTATTPPPNPSTTEGEQ